ncbi:hypothetical protein GCM10009610_69440 [Pseudonocardia xinjiangensis]
MAITRSPAASAASTISRPKPLEQPEISQTRPGVSFVIHIPSEVVFTEIDGRPGTPMPSNTGYLSQL